MADVAELKIKPVLAGNARTLFSPLSKGLRGVGSLASGVGRTLSGAISKLTSIPSLIAGFAIYGGGRSLLEATIGSADDMAMAEARMKGILGTTENVDIAMSNVSKVIKEIPSLGRSDAVQGMENFLSVTKGSVEESTKLVKIAKALEATSSDQSFGDAQFAIKELIESGDALSLKDRFGLKLPTSQEAKKLAKRDGKVLSTYYLDTLLEKLGGKYGQEGGQVVDFLLGIDRNSVQGKMAQIKSVVTDTMTSIGSQAREPVLKNLGVVADKWTAMVETPEFKSSIVRLSDFFASTAGAITGALPGLIDKLPGAMKSVMDAFKAVGGFYDRHPTLVKVLGGMAAANWVTGGAIGKMGGSLLSKGAGKAAGALGIGKGAAAIGAGGMGGCCCDGGGGTTTGSKAEQGVMSSLWSKGKNLLKFGSLAAPAAAEALTAVELSAVTMGTGALAMATAAAAIPLALGAIGVSSYVRAMNSESDFGKSDTYDQYQVGQFGQKFESKLNAGDLEGIKSEITQMLGGKDATLDTDRQQSILDVMDRSLSKIGLSVDLDEGAKVSDMEFDNTWFSGKGETAEKLNKTEITVNVAVPAGSPVSEEHANIMGDAVGKRLSEEARKSRAKR